MYIKNRGGQSTVEYILLVTAVIAVMVVFATNKSGGIQGQLGNALNEATGDIGNAADVLSTSHQPTTSTTGSTTPPITIDVTNGVGN